MAFPVGVLSEWITSASAKDIIGVNNQSGVPILGSISKGRLVCSRHSRMGLITNIPSQCMSLLTGRALRCSLVSELKLSPGCRIGVRSLVVMPPPVPLPHGMNLDCFICGIFFKLLSMNMKSDWLDWAGARGCPLMINNPAVLAVVGVPCSARW
jgi:hypothetical protein